LPRAGSPTITTQILVSSIWIPIPLVRGAMAITQALDRRKTICLNPQLIRDMYWV
jgi:hypothetical protein